MIKSGTRVKIIVDTPGGQPVTGTVKVVQDLAGQQIGVELDDFVDYGHSLNGLVEERHDATRDITVGKGWWTLEGNIEVLA
jgi:hypothetical protein